MVEFRFDLKKFYAIIAVIVISAGIFVHAFVIEPANAQMSQIVHDTRSDFAAGTFNQTILQGTETAPEIRLDSSSQLAWFFQDDEISGWGYNVAGNVSGNVVSEENPSGQIHVKADYVSAEAYGYAYRTDVAVPNDLFVAEYRLYFDSLQLSNTSDPFAVQPSGGCCRLDIQNVKSGMRVDIFADRMVSFYRRGSTGTDYPTVSYFDVYTNVGQWYTLKFEVNFSDPAQRVQVYRDGGWIGELKSDTRNNITSGNSVREMAYSRKAGSGPAEVHIDYVKLGSYTTTMYDNGTYTSDVLDIGATSFDTLTWTEEGSPSPYPWGELAKYSGNPVLSPGHSCLVENMLVDINDPLQQPIQYDGKYWLCYGDGTYIRLASSTDPNLLTWTPYGIVLSPNASVPEYYVYSPDIFRDGSTYYLFYDVALNSPHGSCQRIAYATASAPTGPYTKGPVILDIGAAGQFDDGRVSEPFVFKDGSTYYLFHMGDNYPYGNKEEVALATTSAADFPLGSGGGNWTKYGLILPHNPGPTSWDRGLTADPSVIKVGATFYMLYTGSYANLAWKLGIAWATSPYGPWNRPPAPNVPLGPPGSWDNNKLVRGAIHYNSNNGKYIMPYTGNDGSMYRGGIATADLYRSIFFETRTSLDGSNWESWKAVANGSTIQSTPNKYFQYRATLIKGLLDSPTLTSVRVNFQAPHAMALYIDPPLVEKTPGDVHTTFAVNITVEDVTDLYGFDLNITWNNALITFAGSEFEAWLDAIWGYDGWFLASNETGLGWYAVSAVSLSSSYSGVVPKPLATVDFRVESASPGQTLIHFELAKLGSSKWTSIPIDEVRDGNYRMTSLATTLRMSPDPVERTVADVGSYFNVSIVVGNVTDLFGFDLNITWDNALIIYRTSYCTETLDSIWGPGNWQVVKSEIGSGWYKIVVLSTLNGFNTSGLQKLLDIEFRVEYAPSGETPIHFTVHKLSDSHWTPIAHAADDGLYKITAEKPNLEISPLSLKCRKYGETFALSVNISNALSVEDFEFEIHYNTTLLDFAGASWVAGWTGTVTDQPATGVVNGTGSGAAKNGELTLVQH